MREEGTERYENIPGSITNTTPQIPISHTVRAACGPAFDGLWGWYSCCCRSKSEEGAEDLCELHLENLGIVKLWYVLRGVIYSYTSLEGKI